MAVSALQPSPIVDKFAACSKRNAFSILDLNTSALYYALRDSGMSSGGYMRKTLVLASLILAAGFGLTLAANEKPSEEYSGAMKSNAATGQALKRDVSAKDNAAISKDAATYNANFAKNEA